MQKVQSRKVTMENMLNITVRDLLGPVGQFIKNLLGKHGLGWWEAFKQFLRKELVNFHFDIPFDLDFGDQSTVSGGAPEILVLEDDLGPDEIMLALKTRRLRMGTLEELLAFVGQDLPKGEDSEISASVFSHYGPNQIPCAIGITRTRFGGITVSMKVNQNTAKWLKGNKLLVFPIGAKAP